VEHVSAQAGVPDLLVTQPHHPSRVCARPQPGDFPRDDDVNYFGIVYITKAALPGMLQRGSGHIINIASMAAVIGAFGYSAYGASKFAVRGFSDVLRSELKPLGIRVSIVFQSDTDTPQLAYEEPFRPQRPGPWPAKSR